MPRLTVANPPCVAENFDGEIVALNLDTGLYFSLPGFAGAVWRDLNAGHPSETIIASLAASSPTLGRDAKTFIDSLVFHGLLKVAPEGSDTALAEPEYRAMLERGDTDLTFTAHDDMKDLVMTDPIHDVDEQMGWPVLRTNAG